ncbi:Glycolipid transfer protein domain-containing protein [Cynara cardunculus var. scolymus]|uniref:Glycolipid transfer protein domain-containing protein n=1 Tax=Cynara cardunculus var. scolymus TaxID=59895 RepID=A0A103XSY2_CYNCS|nr:Glycolipid transfer protein domain-containing protein [Cynara cardunculus var. scolymus]
MVRVLVTTSMFLDEPSMFLGKWGHVGGSWMTEGTRQFTYHVKSRINKIAITFIYFPSLPPYQISLPLRISYVLRLQWQERGNGKVLQIMIYVELRFPRTKRMDYTSGDEYEDAGTGTALSSIADAFEEITDLIIKHDDGGDSVDLKLKPFCDACSLVSVLFGCLGIAFKFAEMEYTSKRFVTLRNVVDYDLGNNTVKSPGSLTRNLRRVRQGLDLIRQLFQNFLITKYVSKIFLPIINTMEYYSLKEAASSAYQQVCAPYHTWAVRTAVSAGMCALPSRDQLLLNLNETGNFVNDESYLKLVTEPSAAKEMRRYIKASLPVITYIDNLYISRGITLDW